METETLFDEIAPKYDLLNRLLSLGLDRGWRKAAVKALAPFQPRRILDVATGSGDLALAALAFEPEKITAVDVSKKMLALAAGKAVRRRVGKRIVLARARAEELPFADSSFDAVTAGFGVRNFADLEKGLCEMRRVLKKSGVAIILEFSLPRRFPMKQLHRLYLQHVLPLVGGLFAGNKAAYARLSVSILAFPDREEFIGILKKCGFARTTCRSLSFGICSVYTACR